ncbi:hypothetical protein [Novosphingobium sp. AP12]|uniref:hypothetical protein n=1 Tax=Novosphingobium sp. AP12 TaxID=1144305 RepID=UPI0002720087|nr:hypothetical protein [Novosphingobium sp. AP12]EJL24131.1 hypothetical protein PMI02_03838 [Novosphingobium sp. AP12]
MPIADLPSPPPPAIEAAAFDLAQMPSGEDGVDFRAVRRRCPEGRPGEIVVCATNPEKERVRPLPDAYAVEGGLPRAELGLGENATLDLHVDQNVLPGAVSNRVMVGAKIKF